MDLFKHRQEREQTGVPLADRMRPRRLSEVTGQTHLLASDRLLARAIRADRLPSCILWGPPGTGKTTLAHVIAAETNARFQSFSAVLGGVAELRKRIDDAREHQEVYGQPTILFIDEIHRFNKGQQDALLPHVEAGSVTLIGATTENPSFAVNAALLSRARVFRLESLSPDDVVELLKHALEDEERGLGKLSIAVEDDALTAIAIGTRGDARRALNLLELATSQIDANRLTAEVVEDALGYNPLLYDKSGEEHFNVVSAFIKSMRGSDPNGAVYWMMRMLEAGDDPRYVLRRMIIFASEDIGNADPQALTVAVAADAAFRRLGMPEGLMPLGQCCTYLASAPKSDASYRAWTAAQEDVKKHGALPVPMKLRNAPTQAMKDWGYGDGYRNPHRQEDQAESETYLPDKLVGRRYYKDPNPKDPIAKDSTTS